ncbi:MAG TPA: zinc ribbon domain-containing protein [Thermoplasmata archaeon]|nr:zinc ribbon domain-containing protein [Thermoplasmata archaeon]
MTVCLHCGENGPEGALFCAKCGYTLPQVDTAVTVPPPATTPTAMPMLSAFTGVPATPSSASMSLAGSGGAATGPIAPPPSGKYCIRCRTIIARAAVFCPVCQQPQTP